MVKNKRMKKTPLKRIGEKGKENLKYKSLIKELDLPQKCEVQLSGCLGNMYLTPAHRHKRSYYKTAEELADPKHIIVMCVKCHDFLEHKRDLHDMVFNKLRGDE